MATVCPHLFSPTGVGRQVTDSGSRGQETLGYPVQLVSQTLEFSLDPLDSPFFEGGNFYTHLIRPFIHRFYCSVVLALRCPSMTTTQLSESQTAFCEASIGNIRLLAPAGYGKTLSILHRCLYLARHSERGRPQFLIVTFTRAARDELQSRLNEDDQFGTLRDTIDIATLNSWGFRRIKTAAFSPKLITTKKDYHFTVLNQLQPI
ncbi:MAG: hypothetical protein TH68_07860 [Candidatus Synechococcus spongiarum 142]|uniref:UvrD-like helicase ATP-binding domain-containing protein n=1 Tax=Candidatus Synechococcus spongiarum 142 TaxID=1608213 RepID=A0A6N3WZ36_9SYNE|nr:MAG: hypothetical protein TH68_07860 [Candidatus Synechococcus spongiarum 142]